MGAWVTQSLKRLTLDLISGLELRVKVTGRAGPSWGLGVGDGKDVDLSDIKKVFSSFNKK